MSSQRSHTRTTCLTVSFALLVLAVATPPAASGQATPDLFTEVETLTLRDGTPASGLAAISGDTAIINFTASGTVPGGVDVFERAPGSEHWFHAATLAQFGHAAALDGNTIVVGAGSLAYVFERDSEGCGRSQPWLSMSTGSFPALRSAGRPSWWVRTTMIPGFASQAWLRFRSGRRRHSHLAQLGAADGAADSTAWGPKCIRCPSRDRR